MPFEHGLALDSCVLAWPCCTGWQDWSGADTLTAASSTAAQPSQTASQNIVANVLPTRLQHQAYVVACCAGWQDWSGGDTSKQTPSTAAQPSQTASQNIVANTLPNPDVNPLAIQPITTPGLGTSQRRIAPQDSCNPRSGNSTLNGCITPQVRDRRTNQLNVSLSHLTESLQEHPKALLVQLTVPVMYLSGIAHRHRWQDQGMTCVGAVSCRQMRRALYPARAGALQAAGSASSAI